MNIENFVRALADAVASECGLVDNDMDAHYQDYKVENGKILSVTTEGETMTVHEMFYDCVFAEAVIDSELCKYIAICANGYNIKKLVLPKDFYNVEWVDEKLVINIRNNKRFIFD